MPRHKTPEQKAAWAAYMRQYRATHKDEGEPKGPLQPTARQLEILRMYADPIHGGTERAVAEALGISVSAVHNQLQRVKKRLDVRDAAQAVMKLWVNDATTTEVSEPLGQRASDVTREGTRLQAGKTGRRSPTRERGS